MVILALSSTRTRREWTGVQLWNAQSGRSLITALGEGTVGDPPRLFRLSVAPIAAAFVPLDNSIIVACEDNQLMLLREKMN
jgi:hypothetical protein